MFSGAFETPVKTVVNNTKKNEDQPVKEPLRLRKVIRAALAVRKFQKLESDKFKQSIECEFDKTAAINELKGFYQQGSLFHLEHSKKLAYYTRKFTITFNELKNIHANLLTQFSDHLKFLNEGVSYFLCLSLKYLTRNSEHLSNEIRYSDIINLIKRCDNESINTELVYTLTFMTEKSTLSKELVDALSSLVFNRSDLNEDAKVSLLARLEINKTVERREQLKSEHRFKSAGKHKPAKLAVTKTIQTVKSTCNNKESEETKMMLLNLSDALKNRNKTLNMKTTLEKIDTINDTNGNNRAIWRTTWAESVNLYSLVVVQGQALKSDDKDNYLPNKLFGWQVCLNTKVLPENLTVIRRKQKVYSFFINRMIAVTLRRASKKQQLNGKAIDQLMQSVTDLKSFSSIALHCDDDMVDLITNAMHDSYYEFIALTEPDFAVDFIKRITNKTVQIVVEKGWIWDSTTLKWKSFNRAEVTDIIKNELNAIRLDCLNAIYNCAIRDKRILTTDRMKKIQKCLANHEETDAKFTKLMFQIMSVADSNNDFDYQGTFQTYIDVLVHGSSTNIGMIVNFLNNQAKDRNRSRVLFTDQIISKLIGLLLSDIYETDIKEDLMKIINNYLEHETNKSLNDEHLNLLIDFIINSINLTADLINSVLTTLLLIAEKQKSLSKEIINRLIDNMESFGDNSANYIIVILSRIIQNNNSIENEKNLEKISSKLTSIDVAQLDSDSNITFTQRSEENQGGNSISLLAANLLLLSVQHQVQITNPTINNIMAALNSDDKQTKIISSKCIYSISKYMPLDSDVLNQMKDFLNDQVYDVSTYILSAYLHGLVRLSQYIKPIDTILMDDLSLLFITGSLKLGEVDYAQEINSNILKIYKLEAAKQQFEDSNVFILFDTILTLNENETVEVLEILHIYTNEYIIPSNTVQALESTLGFPEHFEKSFMIFQNIIRSGQVVTTKILQILADNLYMSINTRRRYISFKLLEIARQNQDLPSHIFCKTELTKAGFVLSRSTNKKAIFQFMKEQTNNGIQLPIDTIKALESETKSEDALQILCNISKSKQIIQYDLLNKLIEDFDPHRDQLILIDIFENVAKNNQTLSPELLRKLEIALNRQKIEDKVLSIFIYLAQKGDKLSQNIIEKILKKISMEKDFMLKQELLSAVGSLIESHYADISQYQSKIQDILVKELNSDKIHLQKISINIVRILSRFVKIDSKLFNVILTIGTNLNCDFTIKDEIYSLFISMENSNPELINKHKGQIQLANLNYQSNSDLLNQLRAHVNHGNNLLEQNYNQFKTIIDQDVELQERVLEILHLSKSKNRITDDLIESLVLLYESTSLNEIKNSCSQLFEEINKSGKSLQERAAKIVSEKQRNDKAADIEKLFIQTNLYKELKTLFQFNDQQINVLFQVLKIKTNILEIKNVDKLIEIFIQIDPIYYNNPSFVYLIEQTLYNNELALICYCQIIKEKKCQKAPQVLDQLVQLENEVSLLPVLVESIYYALKTFYLSENCIITLENHLNHPNPLVRNFSFKGLNLIRKNTQYKPSQRFESWCRFITENFSNAGVEINKTPMAFDLLETVVSLEFIDFDVFRKHENKYWIRELIISSLFKRFEVDEKEKLEFYTNWFTIEETFMYQKSVKMLCLINQKVEHFKSITDIIDLFIYVSTRPYDDVMFILNTREFPCTTFKRDWCMKMIKQRFINKNIDANYLERLCINICTLFNMKFIGNLFECLSDIDNIRQLEDVIQFCSVRKIDLNDLDYQNLHVSQLKSLLEIKYLCKKIKSNGERNNYQGELVSNFDVLMKKKWTFDQLDQLVDSFNSSHSNKRIDNFVNILKLLNQYNLSSSQTKKCNQVIRESNDFINLLMGLNKLVIENNFQLKGKVKNSRELLAELEDINATNPTLVKYIRTELPIELAEIKREDLKSLTEYPDLPIAKWGIKQINHWSTTVKSNTRSFSHVEAIAVIKQANFLFTGYHLTDTQILCSLIALQTESNIRGKLLQVATGEGKSTIVCILAIIHALKNKHVHVITSSPVLAERDSNEKKKLFKMFYLNCADNNDKTVYLHGRKDCYKAHIVYGEVSQFQFDSLRHHYSMLGTLGESKCEIAIVDEVDSMLIDDSSKIARLSSAVAGMDYFQLVYVYLWQRLLTIKERFIMFNNKMYMIYGKVGFENGKIILEYCDDNNNVIKIPDLENHVSKNNDISDIGEAIDGDLDEYLKKSLDNYLSTLVKEKKIEVPKNYAQFYETQKPKWIFNAIEALNYEENIHYIVQEGQIKPVDYFSTGIVQSSTNWSDGLHQFLQIKHNLKMTSETLTTNFLSNIGFIKNYSIVYGLTGTLGSEKAKTVLNQVYKVNLVNIPSLRQKQYLELETIVAQDERKWAEQICSTVLIETKKDRGILIICENIAHANQLGELLKQQHRSSAVKLYTMNNMNQEKHVEKILPGEIIIATNLAGRGTDIRTDEIEEFGGLHVVVTFMPNNQRVEDQAFGRTARQGKRGTGLMILNAMNLIDYKNINTKEVKQQRDEIESKNLDEFQLKELKLIETKDNLFKKFSQFLNGEIRQDIRYNQGLIKAALNATVEIFKTIMPTVYESNILAAVEEQWAMFLKQIDDGKIQLEQAEKECDKFIQGLKKAYKEGTIIKNAYYHIVIANDIIVNQWKVRDSSKAKDALIHFEKATGLDDGGFGAAHFGIAWCSLIIQQSGYKQKALESFKKSLELLSNEMAMLNAMQLILEQKQPAFTGSELYKQFMTKTTILGTYLNSIQSNISAIKKSLRFIDIVGIELHPKKNILEAIEYHYELERNAEKNLSIQLNKNSIYSLTFNDLTTREDSGTIDQALITIQNAYRKRKLPSSYNHLCITLKQTDLDRVKIMFNQDKEYFDLSKESAIAQLKSERTVCNALRLTDSYEVDLHIKHSDNKVEKLENKQMNQLIGEIEKRTDDTLRFDIIIKNANINEVNKYFKRADNNIGNLQVDFDRLDYESASEKLSLIKSNSFNIDMVLTKSILSKMISSNAWIQNAKVCRTEQKLYQKIDRVELLKRVNELENDDSYFYIKLESLQINQIKSVINENKEISFGISFIGIDFYKSIKGLDGQANFYFDKLDKSTSEMIIKLLRTENIEFSLTFQNLEYDQVEYIVSEANLDQENIQINKVRNIMELYTKNSMPTAELHEFTAKGIEYMLEINEKRFIPWRSVAVVAVLGSLQILAGGILICTGFGASVGMGVITEGLADMFTAYRAFSNRQFSWNDYCKQKAVSLIISAVSMGYSKLKDAGKGVKNLAQGVGTEALEQAGTQFATNAKTVGQTMAQTGKNLKSLAFKYTGVKAGEAVVREGLNSGVQYLTNFSFDLIRPQICESVQSKVRAKFGTRDMTYLLRKMYALDLQTKSKALQFRIDQIVADIVNPKHDFARRQWDSIGGPLLKGILATSENYGGAISMTIRILGTLNGLHSLFTMIDNVYEELIKKLTLIDKNTMTFTLILHRNLKMDKENAQNAVNVLKTRNILDENDNLKLSSYYDVTDECNQLKCKLDGFDRKNVVEFMKSFCDQYIQVEYDSFSIISKSVADKITEQLIQIIESQLIQPWSTLAVSSVTNHLSNQLQHKYLVNEDQNSDSQNKDKNKFEDLKDKENLTEDEKAFMKNYGKYRTITEQINYNSKDYCIAYTQCEIAYHSKNSNTTQNGKSTDKKVQERVDGVRGNKPATMAEMSAASEKYSTNIKVVDDENYERTQEEIDNNVVVVYVEKGSKDANKVDQVGHAYYIDEQGNRIDIASKPNDCFYGVLSKVLETRGINKSVETIRNELANDIQSNGNYSKVLEAENWMHERYPHEANTLLFAAGLRLVPSNEYVGRENEYKIVKGKKKTNQPMTDDEEAFLKDYEAKAKLEVEPGDPQKTRDSVKAGKPRGHPYDVHFKHVVPTGECPTLPDDSSYHHIVPNNELITLIPNTGSEDNDIQELNNYVNKPHIRQVIIDKDLISGRKDHGRVIYASIANNPNNLVYGPSSDYRGDDPGGLKDNAVGNAQSADHQDDIITYEQNKTLDAFGNIRAAQPVAWEQRSDPDPTKNNKYFVKTPPKESN